MTFSVGRLKATEFLFGGNPIRVKGVRVRMESNRQVGIWIHESSKDLLFLSNQTVQNTKKKKITLF